MSVPGVEISPRGLNLINGRYAIPPGDPETWATDDVPKYRPKHSGLSLKLSKAAKRRLATESMEILVSVERVFAVFPSQFCMIVTELAVSGAGDDPLPAYAIGEAVHVLSHKNRSKECGIAAMPEATGISLHDLIRAAVPDDQFQVDDRTRSYAFSTIVLDEFPDHDESVEHLAFRCAHRYTTDYRIHKEEVIEGIYRPFESVIHSFALEGAASILDGSDEFVSEQFMARVRQAYLWLVVMACHEQAYLLWLVGRNNLNIDAAERKPEKLKELIDEFLEFRLVHSVPLVSNIEMHNLSYELARRKLHLNELVQKVTHDVVEVERWLTQQREHARIEAHRRLEAERERRKALRQRFAPGEICLSAFLMFGLTFLAFDALLRKVSQIIWSTPDLPQPWNIVWPVAIACAAAMLRGWQVRSEIYEEPVSEEMLGDATLDETANIEAGVGVVSVSNSH